MAHNTQLDSSEFVKIDFPYDKSEVVLSDKKRFVNGENSYVTVGGTLCKRPGSIGIDDSLKSGYRIDRLWLYETLETPAKIYFIASMKSLSMGDWSVWYLRLGAVSPAWTQLSNTRAINQSTRAHEGNASKGLFYIKGYPSALSSEKLGTVIFDGTDASTKLWGLLPPTVPAALAGAVTRLTTAISSTDTVITVNDGSSFPATPFFAQLDFETITVLTNVANVWTVIRGANGTVPTDHGVDTIAVWRDWSSSSHQVDVNIGWRYTYAYKSITGQYSNRSPLETNPDKLPSSTGPFQDLIPKFVIQGTADTVNIPEIGIFRSTDGGGTYFLLEDITNTGAGNITYEDDSFESGTSGGVFNDPVPDSELDTSTVAPTLTSNSPPPTVLAPEITGTDTPSASSPIASFNARLWFAIGNVVFYSGNEEISLGIPEECFPSGEFGNFFRYQYQVLNLAETSDYLYVFTTKGISQISGTNRETFNTRPVFENIGVPYSHPRAITRYGEAIAFLTQDLRIAIIKDSKITVVSDPLGTDLSDAEIAGCEFDIKYFADNEKEILVVGAYDNVDSTNTREWVFDIKKTSLLSDEFWHTPWTMRISAMASGQIVEDSTKRRLVLAYFDSDTSQTNLAYLDSTLETPTDFFIDDEVGYTFYVDTNLFTVPEGDHVNQRREPMITPVSYAFQLDRIRFSGDSDPLIYFYTDDLWTHPIPTLPCDPPQRRAESIGYKTMLFPFDTVCQRIAFKIFKDTPNNERFECMNAIPAWLPNSGA